MELGAARAPGQTGDHLAGVQVNAVIDTSERNKTIEELRRALDEHQFMLHYQPKVNSRDGRIVGLEALIRWNHPHQGIIYPARFIPLLEECGLIIAVGSWVLKQAATDYCSWMHQGITPPRIAVNVSPQQLRHKDFIAELEGALRINNVGHAGLDIEITESVLMTELEDCIEKLTSIRELGVRVAIDDFGTGYSSLRYLARLPVDTLKVDQSFISMVTESPNDLAIVSGIIVLAHGLNLDVVAEGVETAEQHKFLRLLRCDQMQGYLFSEPIAKAMMEQRLKSGANITAQAHVASDSQSNRTISEPEFCERRLAAQETWSPK
jgi:EAL domain-containing protein (putative c-di-GMP-specific phosphodiesterase class I)